ncbi:hypothetical protein DJ533_00300 (plasmid) [Acinetobacter defluvii]|uniref:Uncharacterized protein n=1 Tax=Acinetobacter defluvii TaxID=1871111 RepID=A0A2S2F887_9GAMM|nr:hypothetical protein [Acinetobacter defluvii]AWL27159.1 hypothetical protein DJ533_00300 [Acinetobacter defluvii]
MNLNLSLESFLNENLLNDWGNFSMDSLPYDVHSFIESEARAYCGINHMVSSQDIVQHWGNGEKFHEWRAEKSKFANEVNLMFLVGKVSALQQVWRMNQIQNHGKEPSQVEKIDSKQFAQDILDYAMDTGE